MSGHCSGLAMKLVNNMLVQVNTVAVAEALVLGGLPGSIRRPSTSGARLDRRQCGVELRAASSGDYDPAARSTFPIRTRNWRPPSPSVCCTAAARQPDAAVYQMARARGLNKQDGSAVVKIFEQMAGVTVKETE
jgi:3-hydroxyisobutyrate dehydrogenase-like beta-hydroxyacid dehydrogenase